MDHTGVVFSRVLQEDAGQYKVVAVMNGDINEIKAQSILKGSFMQMHSDLYIELHQLIG